MAACNLNTSQPCECLILNKIKDRSMILSHVASISKMSMIIEADLREISIYKWVDRGRVYSKIEGIV